MGNTRECNLAMEQQNADREQALADIKSGEVKILVSTDVT